MHYETIKQCLENLSNLVQNLKVTLLQIHDFLGSHALFSMLILYLDLYFKVLAYCSCDKFEKPSPSCWSPNTFP